MSSVENELDEIVSGKVSPQEAWTVEQSFDYKKKQAKIKRIILNSLAVPLAHRVMKSESGTVMWRNLCDIYEGQSNPVLMQQRQRQFVDKLWNTQMEKGSNASEHLQMLFDLRDKLQVLQYEVHDLDMVELILDSLPDSIEFNELKRTVRYTITPYSPEDLKELILIAEGRSKQTERRYVSNQKKESNNKQKENKRKYTPTYERVCYKCQKSGHIARFCTNDKKINKTKQERKNQSTNESKVNRLQSTYIKNRKEKFTHLDSDKQVSESNVPDSTKTDREPNLGDQMEDALNNTVNEIINIKCIFRRT